MRVVRELVSWKAFAPICSIFPAIVIVVKASQFSKAPSSMISIFGLSTKKSSLRLVQFWKAIGPICFKLAPLMSTKLVALAKALVPTSSNEDVAIMCVA